jgi:phi13 family phage major tail protein
MNANVGMIYPVAATVSAYTPGSSITYGTGKVIAEARSATLTWNREDGHFYGDNTELDSANGVLGYTLDFEPTGLTDEARAYLLGETVSTGEYSINNTASPDVGFGYVRLMRTTGTSGVTDSYEAWWFKKLKFGLGSEESRTKEQNVEWRTPTLNGVGAGVSLDTSGQLVFADHKRYTTLADAKTYLNTKAGIS